MAGCCGHSDVYLAVIKCRDVVDYFKNYYLMKKGSFPYSWLTGRWICDWEGCGIVNDARSHEPEGYFIIFEISHK